MIAFVEERVQETWKLFASDSERSGRLFALLKDRGQDWEKPKACSYRGCSKKSIARSHTLQRSGPLVAIAEAGHVMSARGGPDGPEMKRVGLKDASTFAGFCSEHEALFDSFELTGVIADQRDLQLQIFRGLCRELVRVRHDLKHLKKMRDDLSTRMDAEVQAEAQRLGVGLTRYSYTGGAFGIIDEAIGPREKTLVWLEALYDEHFPFVNGTGTSLAVGHAVQIDMTFPVALSGLGHFGFNGENVDALIGVVPQNGGTLVYMAGRPGSEGAIEAYMANRELDLCLIEKVESWMIRGSDHWFLTPSVWDAIPKERQDLLMEELADPDDDLSQPPSTSIFDAMRQRALSVPMAPDMSLDGLSFIAAQRAKLLTSPPKPESTSGD